MKKVEWKELCIQDNSFDLIRLLAAFSVISTHILAHIPPNNHVVQGAMRYFNGYLYGVVVFFAISGFLIPQSIEKSRNFFHFMKKRLLRIYPGIWCAFIISFMMIMLLYKPTLNIKRIVQWVLPQITILQVYTPGWLRGYGNGTPNGSLWTIIVELQLYIITYVLYQRLKKLSIKKWVLLIACTTALNIGCWLIQDRVPHIIYRLIYISFAPYLYIYFIGVFLFLHRNTVLNTLKRRWIDILCGYTIWMSVFYFFIPKVGFYAPIHIGLTLPIVVISTAYGLGNHKLRYDISYGMYLYHMIIINAIIQINMENSIMTYVFVVLCSVFMGIVQNVCIDKPLLRIRNG